MNIHRRKYTHLFFDLDNTLWNFEENSLGAMQLTFSQFCLESQGVDFLSFFNIYSKNNRLLWEEYRNGKVIKRDLMRLRFQQTLEAFRIEGIDPLEMNTFYLTEMPNQKCLVDGTPELLDYLKRKGYSMFVITNGFREVQHKKLKTSGLDKYFSRVFISEDVKSPKPNKEIFEYAVKSANARKVASLMIGDDLHADVAGALNFGMDAVWFNPENKTDFEELLKKNHSKNLMYHVGTL
ncbi:YjjG family noncanonical pyrimidine nucleotidase, partial [Mariniphaga sediminis]|uniref:YjjG family noncanonical pyrimidine nucleotidase n=1 Tax=Mariniphaga sediminis TaxID=1628158 RepID=UPI0035648F6B